MAQRVDPMPLPPSLAVAEEPIPVELLERWSDAVAAAFPAGNLSDLVAADGPVIATFDVDGGERIARWSIGGPGEAEWAMRHVAAANAELEQHRIQTEEWTRRINDWYARVVRPLEARAAFFAHHLERYALARRAEDAKAKTLTLPSGQVRTRATQPTATVYNEEAVIEWARERLGSAAIDAIVKVVESVRVSELRKVVVVVEVPEEVILTCGCIAVPANRAELPEDAVPVEWVTPAEVAAWTVGSGVVCPQCGEDALVGQWRTIDYVVRDAAGAPVPGVDVRYPEVTATVNAEQP